MKIYSRPALIDGNVVLGTGINQLQLTNEQLELVAALICSSRLGQQRIYSRAAYEILDMIETQFGADWLHQASEKVDLQVTAEDVNGDVLFTSVPGIHFITLEV